MSGGVPTRRSFLGALGTLAMSVAGAGMMSGCDNSAGHVSIKVPSITQAILDGMTLEEKIAQLFVVTPEQLFGFEPVTAADDAMVDRLAQMPVSGITFFGENLVNAQQTQEMLYGMRACAAQAGVLPLFLCVDEEGGLVQRIGGRPEFAAPFVDHASKLGVAGVDAVRDAALGISTMLLDLGFNVDFAPSCDVSSGPASMMHLRSFSTDENVVAEMATLQIETFMSQGLMCCAKHFPGIGEPAGDSHEASIVSDKTREQLDEQLIPFKAAISAGVPFVMVGHLSLPAVTGSAIPASLSPEIVSGMLRDELGYQGIIITDSLGMGAVGAFARPEEVAVMAIEAGCDIALMPPDLQGAYGGLLDAVASGRIDEGRIDASVQRILATKIRGFLDSDGGF